MPGNNITWLKSRIKAPPLTTEEEQELFKLIRLGSKAARDRLIEANLKFVIQVAREYSNNSLNEDDLVNEGCLGLMRAIETFDYSRGVKFITYAVWWIRAHITRAIQDKGSLIRLPANKCEELRKGAKADKLSDELKILQQQPISLSREIIGDTGLSLEDTIADNTEISPDKKIDTHNLNKFLGKFAHKLTDREQNIIGTLFGTRKRKRQSIVTISKNLGISKERIRQIRDQGIKRIASLNTDGHYNDKINQFYAIIDYTP